MFQLSMSVSNSSIQMDEFCKTINKRLKKITATTVFMMGQTIHRGQYGFLHQAVNMLFNAVKWGIIIEKRMGAGFSLQWHQEELQFFSSGGCPCTTNRIQWKIQVCKSTLLSSYYLHDILNVIISKLILIQFLSAVAKKAKKLNVTYVCYRCSLVHIPVHSKVTVKG